MIKSKKYWSSLRVRVTGVDGTTETFNCVKEAAEAIGVTRQYVYMGLNTGRLVAGCKVEVAE